MTLYRMILMPPQTVQNSLKILQGEIVFRFNEAASQTKKIQNCQNSRFIFNKESSGRSDA